MIVADASWVIALRQPVDLHHVAATASNERIDERVTLHAVTLAECLVGPARNGTVWDAAAELRSGFEIVGSDDDVAAPIRWAELRVGHALRLPDAIVLDTALVRRASAVATFDERLGAAARRHGIEVVS